MSADLECDHEHLWVFNYENNEKICKTCGLVRVSDKFAISGTIVDMDDFATSTPETEGQNIVMASTSTVTNNDEFDIDNIIEDYKRKFEYKNKPKGFGYYPRAADYTASGRMATMISQKNTDYSGKSIKSWKNMERMRLTSKIVNSKGNKEMSYRSGMQFIVSLSERLFVSQSIKEKAAMIFKQAYDAGLVKGKSHKGISIASLFFACKEADLCRDVNDFVKALGEERAYKNTIFLHYKLLVSTLNLDPILPDHDVKNEIRRTAARFSIDTKILMKALEIYAKLEATDRSMFFGKSPTISALCIVMIASRYYDSILKYSRIKEFHDVSFITVKNRFDSYVDILKNVINEPLPPSILEGKPI